MKLQWKAIDQPYMRGVEATRENRRAEVVRCYESEWTTFYYENEHHLRLYYNPPTTSFMEARSHAALFLNTGKIRLFNR